MRKSKSGLFIFTLVLFICLYFRSFNIDFPQLYQQAENDIILRVRKEAAAAIEAKFPSYSSLTKSRLIEKSVADYKKSDLFAFETDAKYSKLKEDYQDKNKQTFLQELDCWHWAHYTQNILQLGHPWDKQEGNRKIDSLMLSPLGSTIIWPQFLFYFSAFLYKAFCLIWPIPLFTFLFYLPLFYTFCLLTLVFLFSRRYLGDASAIIACLVVGLAPIFLSRSLAGWFDTDVLNLIFPFLVVWAYLTAQNSPSVKRAVFWLALSGFWVGLFCATWLFWWISYFIIIFYEIVAYFFLPGEKLSSRLQRILLFSLFSAAWIFIFCRQAPFLALPQQFFSSLLLNDSQAGSVWPNTFFTVSELRKVDIWGICRLVGSEPLFFSGLASMVLLFLKRKKYASFKQRVIIIFVAWFALMLFACTKGSRFVIFLLIPLGICFGCLMEDLVYAPPRKNKLFFNLLIVLILLVTLLPLVRSAEKKAKESLPMMDRQWYALLEHLRLNTPQDAVINSWWDYGDWFTAVANRPVIIDGHTQEYPQSYWMAKALLSDSEEEAIAILRMLNNAANQPFETINRYLHDPYKSLFILKKALARPQETSKILEQYLPAEAAKEVGAMLLAKPKHKAYFIVDGTMIFKMPAISYLGTWDAAKVYLAKNMKKGRVNLDGLVSMGIEKEHAKLIYEEAKVIPKKGLSQWASRPLKFYSKEIPGEKFAGSIIFKDFMAYSPESKEIKFFSRLKSEEGGKIKEFYLFENNQVVKKSGQANGKSPAALIYNNNTDYYVVVLSPPLAQSLFTRLYFLDGKGLKHFLPFYQENNSDGFIKVFEIIWE